MNIVYTVIRLSRSLTSIFCVTLLPLLNFLVGYIVFKLKQICCMFRRYLKIIFKFPYACRCCLYMQIFTLSILCDFSRKKSLYFLYFQHIYISVYIQFMMDILASGNLDEIIHQEIESKNKWTKPQIEASCHTVCKH